MLWTQLLAILFISEGNGFIQPFSPILKLNSHSRFSICIFCYILYPLLTNPSKASVFFAENTTKTQCINNVVVCGQINLCIMRDF